MTSIIILAIFLTLLIAIAFFYRKATLKNLKILPGETFIFEEYKTVVQHIKRGRIAYFGNCVIKISKQRLVIAQKIPFYKNSYFIRFLITLSDDSIGVDLKATLKNGYVTAKTLRENISVKQDNKGEVILIPIGPSEDVEIKSKSTADFMSVIL